MNGAEQTPASAGSAMDGGIKPALLALLGLAAVLGAVGFVFAKVDFAAGRASEPPAVGAKTEAAKLPDSPDSLVERLLKTRVDGHTPEGQLILGLQQLAGGDDAAALATIEQLVKRQPDFALAQLLLGDLLLARSGRPDTQDAQEQPGADGLRMEAKLRLAALVERPPAGALPQQLLGLSTAVRHAIVVDTGRARLYLFENGADGLRLVRDSYVSIGKLGTGKLEEGDQRTPLGTYHIGLRRDEAAARYGAAALPLNYPSEYDRVLGRSGSSIWLHGERAGNYARGPLSTDGCIVLSNDEMSALADTVAARETPVLIVDKIVWVDRQTAASISSADAGFEQTYRAWQQARLAQDATALRGFYEAGLERGSDSAASRLDANLALMAKHQMPVQSLERLSSLAWPDQPAVKIVTYRELSTSGGAPKLKRQYWREKEGHWVIFFDGLVG